MGGVEYKLFAVANIKSRRPKDRERERYMKREGERQSACVCVRERAWYREVPTQFAVRRRVTQQTGSTCESHGLLSKGIEVLVGGVKQRTGSQTANAERTCTSLSRSLSLSLALSLSRSLPLSLSLSLSLSRAHSLSLSSPLPPSSLSLTYPWLLRSLCDSARCVTL